MSKLLEILAKRQKNANGDGPRTAKLEDGRNRLRILPSVAGDDEPFFHDFGQHWIKDIDPETGKEKVRAVYICSEKTYDKPCEICSSIEWGIRNSKDDAVVKLLSSAKAGHRILVNALHLSGPTPDVPQVFEIPVSVLDGFSPERGSPKVGGIIGLFGEFPDLLSLDEGNDVIIEKTGKGMLTKYSVSIAAKSKPVPKAVFEKAIDLSKFLEQMINEQQALRALRQVNAVAGLLTPPTDVSEVVKPSSRVSNSDLSSITISEDEDDGGVIDAVEVETVAAPVKAVKAATAVETTGDDDLDALLAELNK